MRVIQKSQLVIGHRYWYISVPQCCHLCNLTVKSQVFVGGLNKGMNNTSVYGMIIFDDEKEAYEYRDWLSHLLESYMIPM